MKKKLKCTLFFIFRIITFCLTLYACSNIAENDTEPPSIVITNPANGIVVTSSISIKVDVTDNDAVKKVQFIIDGELIGEDTSQPFQQNWNVAFWADGNIHTILAKAIDKSNNIGQSEVISVIVSENTMSTVTLIAPKSETFRDRNKINLIWKNIFGASQYELHIATDNNFNNIVFSKVVIDTFINTIELTKGQFYWRVRGQNSQDLWTAWSSISSFEIDGPQSPVLIEPQNYAVFDTINVMEFIWNQTDFTDNYNFELATDGSFLNPVYSLSLTDTISNISNLSNGNYYWRVKGQNSINIWGDWSITSSFSIRNFSELAFYPFKGNANDESGSGYNGTVHGASLTVDRFGNSNGAYSFNGVNNYIDISYSDLQPGVLFQNSFSIEAWIKLNSTSGTQTICSFGYDTGDPMLFEIHEGKMRIHMELQGGDYKPARSTLEVNVWYHVKLVGELGKGITFYLNDIDDGKETVWGSMNGTLSAIGAGYDGSPGRFFNGLIDDSVYLNGL